MRSRLVMVLAAALATAAVIVVATDRASSYQAGPPDAPLSVRAASYLGVYERGALTSYQPITTFAAMAGRQPTLAGYFSGWGEPFKTAFAVRARDHGAATLVQIDPTYASVASIAAGDYDEYLRSYADAVRAFGHPVVIGFGHEMNANWYAWGYGQVPARTFVAAWRHVVTLFRQQGASNVTWLWTIQADIPGSGPIATWWPGASYVTWVGIDGYYYRPSDTFASVFGNTIAQVRFLTSRPILLSETAVGPGAQQPAKIGDLLHGMAAYQTLGLVWFDIAQHDGIYHQDWRLEGDPAAEREFRQALSQYLRPGGDTLAGN
jgi:mannan endo-1,4-beta-mannosidase